MPLVRDTMSTEVKLMHPDRTVTEAAETMKNFDVGALPIVEEDKVVGMLTDRDIAVRVVAEGKSPGSIKIRDAMTSEVGYCYDDQDVQEVAQVMRDKAIRRVVVMDRDDNLVGMCSLGDLAAKHDETKAGKVLDDIARKPADK